MQEYEMDSKTLFAAVESREEGLREAEARERLRKDGRNRLPEKKRGSVLSRILRQLADPMVITLCGAATVSALTAGARGEGMADAAVIFAVVLLNTTLGVLQERKAENALAALRALSAPTAAVLRDGKAERIAAEELVRGDIVLLEAGDAVPADGVLIACTGLTVEESALTGESVPSEKNAKPLPPSMPPPLPADRHNCVFLGSTVTAGRGRMVVTGTGSATEMGSIAEDLNAAKEEQTPLQKRLARLSRGLTVGVLAICAVMFAIGLAKTGTVTPASALDTFMLAVSLAVAAIPEGLCAVVTVVLSMGVTKMSKRRAIVRRLTAVETLGCTQVICTDKTGTLTQNRMTVTAFAGDLPLLCRAVCLCNDAQGNVGDPTETALLSFASEHGIDPDTVRNQCPRTGEIPFDSARRRMTTVHRFGRGFLSVTKGAPDEILSRSHSLYPASPLDRAAFSAKCEEMASQALRVLGVGVRFFASMPEVNEELEKDLTFVGLCGMRDPVRPEVKDAVATCLRAGIRPVMITGDHSQTAGAVGRELGLFRDGGDILCGAELDRMTDEELAERAQHTAVFARVSPAHKARIVRAFRERGLVTAMTGDGVNDAPAIRLADIGIGMGKSGTDVTKNVASLLLADDNFATIVAAVAEGRRIYENIRLAVRFLLSSNLGEVIVIFTATLLGIEMLSPLHLLFINLITDSLPALALGMQPAAPDLMTRPPRDPKEGLLSFPDAVRIGCEGLCAAALTVLAYFAGVRAEYGQVLLTQSGIGASAAFLTLSMAEVFHAVGLGSRGEPLFTRRLRNPALFGSVLLALLVSAAVLYFPPLPALFGFKKLPIPTFLFSLLTAALMLLPAMPGKVLRRRKRM